MGIRPSKQNLSAQPFLVTGGAQGLGLVCARALLEHGVEKLAIFDVDEDMGAKAIEHFESMHNSAKWTVLFEKVDVTDERAVNEAVKNVSDSFNGIHILLCFAGITESKLAVEYNIDSWRRIFDVNVHGSFLVARAVARFSRFPQSHIHLSNTFVPLTPIANRDIIARPEISSASIVFTASMSGYVVNQPQPHSAYAVSKAGVHHLARSMAGEWVGHGIRVNSISPGIMNTRLSGGPSQMGLRRLWLEKSPMVSVFLRRSGGFLWGVGGG